MTNVLFIASWALLSGAQSMPSTVGADPAAVESGLRQEIEQAVDLVCQRGYAKMGAVKKKLRVAAVVDADDKTIVTAEAARFGEVEIEATYFFMREDLLAVQISIIDTREQLKPGQGLTRAQVMGWVQRELVGGRPKQIGKKKQARRALRRCTVDLSGDIIEGFDLKIERK